MPQVLSAGGPVLANPRIVPVFYPGDDKTSVLLDFSKRLVASAFWHQTVSEYGVGPGTVTAPFIRSEAAPLLIFDMDIEAWLRDRLDAHDPLLPAPDENTLYALFFPSGTTVSFATDPEARSCINFGAWHSSITLASGRDVAYAALPRCDVTYRHFKPEDELTLAPAHEFAEAATDPFASTYGLFDFNASPYQLRQGSEIADMCEFIESPIAYTTDVGYPVQREWSNRASVEGHDPCQPALAPYFNAVPLVVGGTELYQGAYSRGLTLTPGESVTIDVALISDGPIGPWSISADNRFFDDVLTLSFDQPQGRGGDTRRLTLTLSPDAVLEDNDLFSVEIVSTLDGHTNRFPLSIGY